MEIERPPHNPVYIDCIILAILVCLVTTEITVFSIVLEELQAVAIIAFSIIAVVHLNIAAVTSPLNGNYNSFSEHTFLLTLIPAWLLFQSSEWALDLSTHTTAIFATQRHAQAAVRGIFITLIYSTIITHPHRPYFRVIASIAFFLLPLVNFSPISDNHAKQAFQTLVFMFNYAYDFVIDSYFNRSSRSSVRSTVQAIWCLVSASPWMLCAGTIMGLFLHIVDITLDKKVHFE